MRKQLTLCVVTKNEKILLGMKKRGFGAGRWNGFGGKVEVGESLEEAAKRELIEESGIIANNIKKVGILDFEFQNDPKILEVHIFHVDKFKGKPTETEEMKPQWFNKDTIPYDKMWSDDIYWLPILLSGKKFKGRFSFDQPSNVEYSAKIIDQELKEISSI
jgi:8-oxo-dGTP diphosphatase / 2-hydroxy-dATP diphosphatase